MSARRMLVIGAHSADFVWRSGGAIAVTTENGGHALVIALSYGERGESGEVIVLTMPEPRPVALVGELLATQAHAHGAAGMLIDASIRDLEQLVELGLPIWARWVRVRGADKDTPGTIGDPVQVGGATIRTGDLVVLDADGAAIVEPERVEQVLAASRQRAERELVKRAKLAAGELSYDLDGLRERVQAARR